MVGTANYEAHQRGQTARLEEHQGALLVLLREFDRVCKKLDIAYMLFAGTMLGAVRHSGFIPWDDDLDILMLREDYQRFLCEADTCLDREHFFLQKEFSSHWPMFFSKLRLNGTTCLEKFHPKDPEMHQGVYIDIFPCDQACNSDLGRKMQFYASKIVIAKSLFARGYETDSVWKKMVMCVCRFLPMHPFLKFAQHGNAKSGTVHTFFAAASKMEKNVYPREYISQHTMGIFEGDSYPISAYYDELLKIIYGAYMVVPDEAHRKIKEHTVLVDLNHSYEEYKTYRDNMEFDTYTRSIR